MNQDIIKPFLRWAGGKSLFVKKIMNYFPPKGKINNYYEPFLGAGSLFFAYQPKNAKISDLNEQLIYSYNAIKIKPILVYSYLRKLILNDSEKQYYSIRDKYNKCKNFSIKQAARFIYLNKTCFNGIFRVNMKGEFNVPYGYKKNKIIPTKNELIKISNLLQKAIILKSDYLSSINDAKKNDLIYLDPPYPPLNGTSFFTHYTKERFPKEDQIAVHKCASDLSNRGCLVVITNADTKEIRELYNGWNIHTIERTRWITCKSNKHKVSELVITNYDEYQNRGL